MNPPALPLRVELAPSARGRRWRQIEALLLVAGCGWLCIWQPLAIVLLAALLILLWRPLLGRTEPAAQAIDRDGQGWHVTLADTRRVPVRLARAPWLTPVVAVLPFRALSNGSRLTVLVWPDALGDAPRRRLYRCLRGD